MSTEDQTLDLLAYHAFPMLGSALRVRSSNILAKWEAAVTQTLPSADDLTLKQLRNSVPMILEEIADALSSADPGATRELIRNSKVHGEARYYAHYNLKELVVEYRLLRRVIIEQVSDELAAPLSASQNVALNMAVDTTVQSGLIAFTEHQHHKILETSELQSKYLAFLSHDLRNHLNHATLVLQFLSRRLAQSPEYADSVEDVRAVEQSIFQTTSAMDRLLQAERLRNDSVSPVAEKVDLKKILSQVAEQCQREARRKGLDLGVEVPEGAEVTSDGELLTLVFQNLLGNAVKYSSRGNVKLTATHELRPDAAVWVLRVTDEGPGIPEENLSLLFEAFRRGDTHGQNGMGLGLSIASQATKLLGGKLEIESKVGVGSTFQMVLPIRS